MRDRKGISTERVADTTAVVITCHRCPEGLWNQMVFTEEALQREVHDHQGLVHDDYEAGSSYSNSRQKRIREREATA